MPKLARIVNPSTANVGGDFGGELGEALAVPLPPEIQDIKDKVNIVDTLETNPTVAFDEVGDYILGRLVGIRNITIDGRNQKLYDINAPNLKAVSVWGSTVLDSRMEQAAKKGMAVGHSIGIQYLGDVDTGKGNPAKNFRVIWK
jgi:hypothetical protein